MNSETTGVIISVVNKNDSVFPSDLSKHFLWEQQKKLTHCGAPSDDSTVFEHLIKVTRLDGLFVFLLLCIHEENAS